MSTKAVKKTPVNSKSVKTHDEEEVKVQKLATTKTKESKVKVKEVLEEDSSSDSSSSSESEDEENEVETKTDTKTTKTVTKSKDDSAEESSSSSEQEDDDEEASKKKKVKKVKKLFKEFHEEYKTRQTEIKTAKKDRNEAFKTYTEKQKKVEQLEREQDRFLNDLATSVDYTVSEELKSKKKKHRGNVNGGFNKEDAVPEPLSKFIGLESGATLTRPKLMSSFNNKLKDLGMKYGQHSLLSKDAVKTLKIDASMMKDLELVKITDDLISKELDFLDSSVKTKEFKTKFVDGCWIKFTQVHSFLASYFPKTAKTTVVSVSV